ncbi:hypothetical protein GJAV_G00065820 [Gymnothorax javanicus]|nr:hypothetical protein GJAV_G00065820 [Gymnothorax javanicus]
MVNFKTELILVLFLLSGLQSLEPEVKTVNKMEGETLSLHSYLTGKQTSPHMQWFIIAGNLKTIIAFLYKGDFHIEYERFRNRLWLDRQTWSLNISDLNTNDAGVYKVQVVSSGVLSEMKFNLTVYTPVSKPVITLIAQNDSARSSVVSAGPEKDCSALCSVENGREVTLSWLRDGETLCNTSSPDHSTTLTLTLAVQERNASFTCVAKNPVSIQSVPLNTEEICPQNKDSKIKRGRKTYVPALISSSLLVVIGCAFLIVKW